MIRSLFIAFAAASFLAVPAAGRQGGGIADIPDSAPPDYSPTALTVTRSKPPVLALENRLRFSREELRSGNAALGYLQVCNEVAGLTPEQLEQVNDAMDLPIGKFNPDQAAPLIAGLVQYADLLELAARRERCDWETTDREVGMNLLMPELGRVRQLSRLLVLKARVETARGRVDQAIATLRIGLKLATDVAQGPTQIQTLVGVAIAEQMLYEIERLTQNPAAPNLYWPLTDLRRPFIDVAESMRNEQAMFAFTFPKIRDVVSGKLPPSAAADVFRELSVKLTPNEPPSESGMTATRRAIGIYPAARQWLASRGWLNDRLDAEPVSYMVLLYLDFEVRRQNDEIFKWLGLPYPQAQAGITRTIEQLKQESGPAVTEICEFLRPNDILGAQARLERHIAAIRLVEALRLHAGANGGKLPANLASLSIVPVPENPITLTREWLYRFDGATAQIDCSLLPGETVERAPRYRLQIRK